MHEHRLRPLFTAVLAVTLALLLADCGSGSSPSAPDTTAANRPAAEPSAEFLSPKSPTNKFVTFGSEAPSAVREAASQVLEENLEARASADFPTQCASLNATTIKQVTGPLAEGTACPDALAKLAQPLKGTEKLRADTLSGPIAALRVKGPNAYALFRDISGKAYAMPMEMEGGDWKVAALVEAELEVSKNSSTPNNRPSLVPAA